MHLVFTNKFFLVIIQKGYTLTKKIEHVRKNIAHIFSRVGAVVNPEQNHTKTIQNRLFQNHFPEHVVNHRQQNPATNL